MRHQKSGRKFSRKSGPRHALLSGLVTSLIEHESIRTTDAKAKELRKVAERTISWATSVGSLVGKDKADADDKARIVHAMRMAQRVVKHKPALHKLFEDLGPRLMGRPGGFLRIMKLGYRHGDAAPVSIVEFVDRAAPEAESVEAEEQSAKGKKEKSPKAETKQAAAPAKKKAAKKSEASEEQAEAKPKKAKKKKEE